MPKKPDPQPVEAPKPQPTPNPLTKLNTSLNNPKIFISALSVVITILSVAVIMLIFQNRQLRREVDSANRDFNSVSNRLTIQEAQFQQDKQELIAKNNPEYLDEDTCRISFDHSPDSFIRTKLDRPLSDGTTENLFNWKEFASTSVDPKTDLKSGSSKLTMYATQGHDSTSGEAPPAHIDIGCKERFLKYQDIEDIKDNLDREVPEASLDKIQVEQQTKWGKQVLKLTTHDTKEGEYFGTFWLGGLPEELYIFAHNDMLYFAYYWVRERYPNQTVIDSNIDLETETQRIFDNLQFQTN